MTKPALVEARAALDAVRAHPLARRALQEARGNASGVMRYIGVSSRLAQQTSQAAAENSSPNR